MSMDEVLVVDIPQKPIVSECVCVWLNLVKKWCVVKWKIDSQYVCV